MSGSTCNVDSNTVSGHWWRCVGLLVGCMQYKNSKVVNAAMALLVRQFSQRRALLDDVERLVLLSEDSDVTELQRRQAEATEAVEEVDAWVDELESWMYRSQEFVFPSDSSSDDSSDDDSDDSDDDDNEESESASESGSKSEASVKDATDTAKGMLRSGRQQRGRQQRVCVQLSR